MLDALDDLDATDQTIVVRCADHGEQSMSHRMIEKMYQAYDETMRVPLVVSNPVLFPEPVTTDAFASLVDLFPTLAALAGVDAATLRPLGLAGADLTPVLADADASVQDAVHFTYDDLYGSSVALRQEDGSPSPYIDSTVASHIRAIRERDWKYAVYFTPDGSSLEYEMYDLATDPLEMTNLAFEPPGTDGAVDEERQRLHERLTSQLDELGTMPLGFVWPDRSGPSSAPQP